MKTTGIQDPNASGRALQPPLDHIARGAPGMEDELLAERIEVAGAAWLAGGHVPLLSEILASIPVLRSSPIALDAAIDVVLRGLRVRGLTPEEAAEAIRSDTPELSPALDAHLALKSLLGQSNPAPTTSTSGDIGLPAPFGPQLEGGGRRYELVEFVGSGSEGRVFRAFDRRLSADGRPLPVAIKRLNTPHSARRVTEEAARVTRVRHPGIAALLDCGEGDDGAYLVYEFAEGETLDRWCRRRRFIPARDAADLVRQLAEAVQAAHNAGIVHRDLKPTNVLVRENGSACITDFGLAAAMSARSESSPAGSLAFAAPEQLLGEQGAADASVDVYALGGLLYWLLTARYPNGDSAREIYANLADRRFPAVSSPPSLSKRDSTLARICTMALAPDPADRYSSAGVLAQDLARWLTLEPVLPFDRSGGRRLVLAARRSPLAAAAIGIAALGVFAAIGVAWKVDADRRSALVVAERQRSEREMAWSRERLASQHAQLQDTQRYTRGFMELLKQTYGDSGDAGWLPVLSSLDALTDPDLLDISAVKGDISQMRLRVVTNVLNRAEQEGTRDTVEMTLWETARGYWLLHDNQDAEALVVLRANAARVARVFPEKDPWTTVVEALRCIAEIRNNPDPSGAKESRDWLANNGSTLSVALRKFIRVKTGVFVPEPVDAAPWTGWDNPPAAGGEGTPQEPEASGGGPG